jgi:putative glutamine amidotransferase
MTPLIGITMDSGDRAGRCQIICDYVTSIEKAGGMPFLLPFTLSREVAMHALGRIDGILFTGGDDLDPGHFGEARHPKAVPIDKARETFELWLLSEVERRRKPALGICLGCQLFNVHRGGSLHQFLPDLKRDNPLEHRKLDAELRRHPVKIEGTSKLASAIGQVEISANTYHKQAIARLGRGLRAIAHAPDGIIEAVEDPSLPLFFAVQWHPERLSDEPPHLAVFRMLTSAASLSCS